LFKLTTFKLVIIFSFLIHTTVYGINFTATFDENDFTFRQESGFDVVEYPGCGIFGEEGAPQLLVTTFDFIIPVDQTVESITVNSTVSNDFKGSYYLFPVQPEDYYKLCCDLSEPDWVEPDPEYYESKLSFPEITVELHNTGFFDGANHIASISVYPVSYSPSDSTLSYYSSINFTLNIGGTTEDIPIYPEIRMREDQLVYDNLLYHAVENPSDIGSYGYKPEISDTCIAKDNPQTIAYPFMIITHDSLIGYWDAYVDWINRKGKRVKVVSIQTVIAMNIADDWNLKIIIGLG